MSRLTSAVIDSHCHIQADAFDADGAAVLAAAALQVWRAFSFLAGMWSHLAMQSRSRERTAWTPELASTHMAAGADDATWEQIVVLADEPEVVAIGETGLDYDRGFSPRRSAGQPAPASLAGPSVG